MRSARHIAIVLSAACAIGGSGACAAGCSSEPAPEAPLPEASLVALEGVAEGVVEGVIDGEPFTTLDARFRVVDHRGHERIELLFADRRIERCGLPMERPERLVWLRFADRSRLDPGTYAALGDPGLDDEAAPDFSLHWERPAGEGLERTIRWGDRGIGRVEITSASPTRMEGRVHICFAGSEPACVSGRFDAAPCWSRIDGRTAREPPGLIDEALEPRTRAPRPPRRTYP